MITIMVSSHHKAIYYPSLIIAIARKGQFVTTDQLFTLE